MYLTIDVETKGLHGEAFAVGCVLTDDSGAVVKQFTANCPPEAALPSRLDKPDETEIFLSEHVYPVQDPPSMQTPWHVRLAFFFFWERCVKLAAEAGERLYIAADVNYPCETRFLHDVANDDRKFTMAAGERFSAYPFVDVSSVLLAKGYDPIGSYGRLPDELPAHNPLNDARQSSRVLHTLLQGEQLNAAGM